MVHRFGDHIHICTISCLPLWIWHNIGFFFWHSLYRVFFWHQLIFYPFENCDCTILRYPNITDYQNEQYYNADELSKDDDEILNLQYYDQTVCFGCKEPKNWYLVEYKKWSDTVKVLITPWGRNSVIVGEDELVRYPT